MLFEMGEWGGVGGYSTVLIKCSIFIQPTFLEFRGTPDVLLDTYKFVFLSIAEIH